MTTIPTKMAISTRACLPVLLLCEPCRRYLDQVRKMVGFLGAAPPPPPPGNENEIMALLEAGGELGKRLDFLLQELNREANTMLSKTSGASGVNSLRITELGLEMKAEIEKAREQVQNLE